MDEFWRAHFDGLSPVPYRLRSELPDRWIRFHHLPDSKRYPDSEAEMTIVLERHDALLEALFGSLEFTVVFADYGPDDFASPELEQWCPAVTSGSELWRTVPMHTDDPAQTVALRIAYLTGQPTRHALLRAVAEGAAPILFLARPPWPILYHPYDGGMDIIATTPAQREELRDCFPDWLSKHPSGM